MAVATSLSFFCVSLFCRFSVIYVFFCILSSFLFFFLYSLFLTPFVQRYRGTFKLFIYLFIEFYFS